MEKSILFFAFFLLFFASCKKDSKINSPPSSVNSVNSNVSNNPPPGWQGYCYGVLSVQENTQRLASGHDTLFYSNCDAGFSSIQKPYWFSYGVDADTVIVDNTLLYKNSYNGLITYNGGPPVLANSSSITWSVYGNASVPGFSAIVTKGFPVIQNSLDIPDTIHVNQGLTIPMAGITNADSVDIMIDSQGIAASGLSTGYLAKRYSGQLSSIFISSTELANCGFSANTGTHITFVPTTLSYYTIGTKIFIFRNINQVDKWISLK